MKEEFESTEQTRYVKVFVSEEDMFTITFLRLRDPAFRNFQNQSGRSPPGRSSEVTGADRGLVTQRSRRGGKLC